MKRYFTLFLVFALVAALFVGCGGKDNVSRNEDGMIESSSTESRPPVTVPTTTQSTTTSTTQSESSGLMDDMLPDASTGENGSDSSAAESSSENGRARSNSRSRRGMPKF